MRCTQDQQAPCWWRAAVLAVVTSQAGSSSAAGADADGAAPTYFLFSGIDAWRSGGFAYGGFVWAPQGLGQSGFALKAITGAGRYSYASGSAEITGRNLMAAFMPGWHVKLETSEITIFAGFDAQQHRLKPYDPTSHVHGTHLGWRTEIDYWSEPSPNLMLNGSGAVTTVNAGFWARAAFGWRLFDSAWIGPEISALGDASYRQFRVGAHVTSFKAGPLEWSAGLGFVEDSDHRSGGYARIGLLARR